MQWTLLALLSATLFGVAVIVWIGVLAVRRTIVQALQQRDGLDRDRAYQDIEQEHQARRDEQEALRREILALTEEVRSLMQALQSVDPDGALDRPLRRIELVHSELTARPVVSS